jgi:N-acetylmuramoyl-L-alanine amidase
VWILPCQPSRTWYAVCTRSRAENLFMATIVIDPGHGGSEDLLGSSANHAIGPAGTLEKALTLDVGQRAAQALVSAGHRVFLTRDGDTNLSASDRARVGRENHAQVFLSIHFNAAMDPTLQGTEVLVRPPGAGVDAGQLDEGSRRLAEAIRAQVPMALGIADRGLRPGRWAVLSELLHEPSTARCIVEVAFLSDPELEARMTRPEARQQIADAIAQGVAAAVAAPAVAAPAVGQRIGRRAVGAPGRWPHQFGDGEAYGRPRPQALARTQPYEPPYSRPLTLDWCQLRFGIIKSADEEQGFWLRPNGTLLPEGDPAVLALLEKYWRDGAGVGNAAAMAALSAADAETGPWSAAFISWCVRNAGVPDGVGFDFGSAHIRYIVGALRNRENADGARPFWLLDITEPDAAIIPGDIVCKNRQVRGVWTTHSYASLRHQFWDNGNQNVTPTGSSHSDIAIGFNERDGRRFVEVVGGNVSNSVGSTEYEVDASNRIIDPATRHVFAVIRLLECPEG